MNLRFFAASSVRARKMLEARKAGIAKALRSGVKNPRNNDGVTWMLESIRVEDCEHCEIHHAIADKIEDQLRAALAERGASDKHE